MQGKKAFTLIEVLITIAIIGLMATLLIPNINRSLVKNNIANDAQLLQAKLEQTRLLAGSTQQLDDGKGYYAMYFPSATEGKIVYIIRIGDEGGCTLDSYMNNESCIVEEVKLSSGVKHITNSTVLILFKSPIQQLYAVGSVDGKTTILSPSDPNSPKWDEFSALVLNDNEKTAKLSVDKVTGKLTYKFN